ncbi:MAG: polymorphic toxin-type HINT domain-containing protein, partial [Planctomycetota bacterium]
GHVGAAGRQSDADSPSETLREALQWEIAGDNARRDEVLEEIRDAHPNHLPARWHLGEVQVDRRWMKSDEIPEQTARDPRIAEYRRVRADYPDTVEGHLALAQWCVGKRLHEQARAHLNRVIRLEPNHVGARSLLGHRRIGDQWLSPDEIAETERQMKLAVAAAARWRPKLESIAKGLQHNLPRQRGIAARRLKEIDDPAAVQPLLQLISPLSEEAALRVVETLGEMKALEATVGLAQQAVFSPWEPVRQAAVERLKPRDMEEYVPMLLAAMSGEIQSQVAVVRGPFNQIMYRHMFFREGQDRQDLAVFDRNYQTFQSDTPNLDRRDMLRDAAQRAQAAEISRQQNNAMIKQLNDRILWVLTTATGVQLASSEQWWQYWNETHGVYTTDEKKLVTVGRREQVVVSSRVDDYGLPTGYPGPQPEIKTPTKRKEPVQYDVPAWQRRSKETGGSARPKETEAWQQRPKTPAGWQTTPWRHQNVVRPWQVIDRTPAPWQMFGHKGPAPWQYRSTGGKPWQKMDRGAKPPPYEKQEPGKGKPENTPAVPRGDGQIGYRPLPGPQYQASETRRTVHPEETESGAQSTVDGAPVQGLDCLAGETPVWTDLGAMPLKDVKVGDRVLSQHVETGELAYKPVVSTISRPPGPLLAIALDDQWIVSSGGQPFWGVGEGWVKAWDLKPGSRLHGVAGAIDVGALKPEGNEATYNLVVADFHTFFVGEAKILAHDNTIREPTQAVVPGLVEQ